MICEKSKKDLKSKLRCINTMLLLRFSYERKRASHPLKCHVCGEAFKERHHLTRHMTAHQERQSGMTTTTCFAPPLFNLKMTKWLGLRLRESCVLAPSGY